MKKVIVSVYKDSNFMEAAYVYDDTENMDKYIVFIEKKYGKADLKYTTAFRQLPEGYTPRLFIPRLSNPSRKKNEFNALFRRLHAEDDGVNYE